jgi:hypothetical protein
MAKSNRKVYGHIKCSDCGTLTDINRQEDDKPDVRMHGRFYWNCKYNRTCNAHHRFSPGIANVEDVPGYIPLPNEGGDARIRNVTEPVTKPEPAPAPVTQPETTGGANDWW